MITQMRRTIPGFVWRGDGRVNYNRQPGYEILFQAKIDGRTTYGRRTILLPGGDTPPREGVDISMVAARSDAIPRVDAVGAANGSALKTRDPLVPLRHGAPVSADGQVTFDDFAAVDIRVGRIVEVEDFPEARRPAWKLRVDFGPEIGVKRSSAQIKNYAREDLEGRLVLARRELPAAPDRPGALRGARARHVQRRRACCSSAPSRRPRSATASAERSRTRPGSAAAGRDGAAGGRRRRRAAGRPRTARRRRRASGRRPAATSASGSSAAAGRSGSAAEAARCWPAAPGRRASARRGRRRRPTTRCPAAAAGSVEVSDSCCGPAGFAAAAPPVRGSAAGSPRPYRRWRSPDRRARPSRSSASRRRPSSPRRSDGEAPSRSRRARGGPAASCGAAARPRAGPARRRRPASWAPRRPPACAAP